MKRVSTWLIIAGIIIASIPLVGRLYVNYQQDQMYDDYLRQLENIPSVDIMDEAFEDNVTTAEAADAQKIKPAAIENVIGRISIPSIDSDQLLLEGSSAKEMRFGAGHVTGTALPGEIGNCAISAHRNYTFGSYFSRLGEVATGDLVYVTYLKNTFTYSVDDISVVSPSDVSVLKTTTDASITLITCHPKGSSAQRLIVKGALVVEESVAPTEAAIDKNEKGIPEGEAPTEAAIAVPSTDNSQ